MTPFRGVTTPGKLSPARACAQFFLDVYRRRVSFQLCAVCDVRVTVSRMLCAPEKRIDAYACNVVHA